MKKKCNSPFYLILMMRLVADSTFLVYYLICIYKRAIFINIHLAVIRSCSRDILFSYYYFISFPSPLFVHSLQLIMICIVILLYATIIL